MRVSNAATKAILHEKAEEKWRAYYSNLYYPDQNYLLVYEDGQIVNFLPGTNEPFSLKRYHEESGIDYNRINLCLCTTEDHNCMVMKDLKVILKMSPLHLNVQNVTPILHWKMIIKLNLTKILPDN